VVLSRTAFGSHANSTYFVRSSSVPSSL